MLFQNVSVSRGLGGYVVVERFFGLLSTAQSGGQWKVHSASFAVSLSYAVCGPQWLSLLNNFSYPT